MDVMGQGVGEEYTVNRSLVVTYNCQPPRVQPPWPCMAVFGLCVAVSDVMREFSDINVSGFLKRTAVFPLAPSSGVVFTCGGYLQVGGSCRVAEGLVCVFMTLML